MDQQTPLTYKERKELKRQEKNDVQKQSEQSRKLKRILKWIVAVILVISAGYGLILLSRQGQQTQQLGEAFTIQGQEHIAIGATHPAYNSNPPTSGWHYEVPVAWGMHQDELPDEQLIHNLEHGGIWISYLNVDDSTKSALEKIAESQSKVIVEPRAKNDAPIILASWGRLLKLEKFDEEKILRFIKVNRNQSPEPFAR